MPRALEPGDSVEWETSQGPTTGKVGARQTTRTKIKGHEVAASKVNPQLIVQSDKSGKRAAHKEDALKRK